MIINRLLADKRGIKLRSNPKNNLVTNNRSRYQENDSRKAKKFDAIVSAGAESSDIELMIFEFLDKEISTKITRISTIKHQT
jgi:hypothetical protein